MDFQNSQVDIYIDLCLLLVRRNPLSATRLRDLQRDANTISNRSHSEGISFLTKSLPLLGRALDQGLETMRLQVPRGFKLSAKHPNMPALMQGYFSLIFGSDGSLLDTASPDAIAHIRQVCFFAYKLAIPSTANQNSLVIENFVSVDRTVGFTPSAYTDHIGQYCSRIARYIFSEFDPKDIMPRHGPGAVATGEKYEEKWVFSHLYYDLHQYYPYYDYFVVGTSHLSDCLSWYMTMERATSGRAKVVLVPKDSRGPRLISAEPLEYMWIQQGLGRKLVDHLEIHHLTGGQINFRHQEVNQQLCLRSSVDREFATVDLHDASDNVSLQLVQYILRECPELLRALEASRSAETVLPNGQTVRLNKFAPMGSALCFPIEALCFFLICVSAIQVRWRMPLHEAVKLVYVYGDDILVPSAYLSQCTTALESFGLVVNGSKTFVKGFFRESCGIDAFKGTVVTPLRLKTLWTGSRSDGAALASFTSLANKLFAKGYVEAATYLWDLIDRTYGVIPYGISTSSFPCKVVACPDLAEELNILCGFKVRWNSNYQEFEFFVLSLHNKRGKTQLDSWARLMRDLVMPPFDDPSVVVFSRSTTIKRGWAVA